jgi:hypothetical protein
MTERTTKPDKFDAGVLYAKNLELEEKYNKLQNEFILLNNTNTHYNKHFNKLKHYTKALSDLTSEYDKLKQENNVFKKTTIYNSTINDKNHNIINSIFKIMEINNTWQYKLPIPNPKHKKRIVVDQITQIVGNSIILTEARTSSLGSDINKVRIGDIVLLDITDCYCKKIIHNFSEAEQFTIINLPGSEYRNANPGIYPMEQVTKEKSFVMIRELYNSFIENPPDWQMRINASNNLILNPVESAAEQEKAAKKTAKASKTKPEEEEEEPDIVKKIEFEGKKYLKSKKSGIVYDYTKYVKDGDQVIVGKWNDVTNKIQFQEEALSRFE